MVLRTLLRTSLAAAAALPLLFPAAAQARESAAMLAAERHAAVPLPLPAVGLPGRHAAPERAPVLFAQMGDPRIAQLEEQVRRLNGALEELNFQILQMQDQIRRMQEDNELRFQEIEERRSQAPGATPERDFAAGDDYGSGDDEFSGVLPDSGQVLGQPPRNFGSITFDEHGNFRGGGIAEGTPPPPQGQPDDTTVAALPSGGGADALYRNSYEFILSGDYGTAETGFRELIERYPHDEHAADAHFWLGESLLAQERPREAAEVFLAASREFPGAQKAPDTLFKLGVSLAAMNQRDVACATFAEVGARFPNASAALQDRVRQEQARVSC